MPHPPTNGSQPQSSDVYIAVMGVTGSGKSTFISKCTDQDVKIGHDLQSCTQGIGIYQSSLFSDKNVYLVDTPGFDDTSRTDKEVLKEIATWLGKAYTDNIRLSGIIYLHRITDTRMQGSAKKNLFMFNKLCGSGALKRVILATTMWGNLANEGIGVKREKELVETEEFWGWMTRHGSQIKRHHDTKESAKSLLQIFVSSSDTPMGKLKIQEEIVDRHKTLNQTSAGMELDSAMAQEREKFRKEIEEMKAEMKEAKAARDLEAAKSIEENRQEVLKKIKSLERDREDLKVSFEAMYKERFARLEEQFREMKLERERSVPSIATLASAQRGNFQRRHNYSRSGNYYGGNGSGNYYGGNGRENERDYQRPIVNQWKTCLTCNETFQSRNALFSHLKEREQAGRSHERDYQRPIVNRWKTCLTCNETFQSRNALFNHLREREQAGRSHSRDVAPETPSVYSQISRHNNMRVLPCHICKREVHMDDLSKHYAEHVSKRDEELKQARQSYRTAWGRERLQRWQDLAKSTGGYLSDFTGGSRRAHNRHGDGDTRAKPTG